MTNQKSVLISWLCLLLLLGCMRQNVSAQDEGRDEVRTDLVIEMIASTNAPMGNRPMSLDVKTTNRGPQPATDVFVTAQWGYTSWFESAIPLNGGNCQPRKTSYDSEGTDGNEGLCFIDKLEAGRSATFRFNLVLREDFGKRFPPEGENVSISASTNSRSHDLNDDDNRAFIKINVKPDPNEPPEVKFVSPEDGPLLNYATSLILKAIARDPDGVIDKIEFYSEGGIKTTGIPERENLYRLELSSVVPGRNYVEVCATDNGGRTACDSVSFYVNGPVEVAILSPQKGKTLNPDDKVTVIARVTPHGRAVSKVEVGFAVFADNTGEGLEAKLIKTNNDGVMDYKAVLVAAKDADDKVGWLPYWEGTINLAVRVTDQAGVVSFARGISFKINHLPSITLSVKQNPAKTLTAPANIELVAQTEDSFQEKMVRVDFYADGKLIGSQVKDSTWREQYNFTWNKVEAGEYTITATVTDDNGATANSAPLLIKVRPAPR